MVIESFSLDEREAYKMSLLDDLEDRASSHI